MDASGQGLIALVIVLIGGLAITLLIIGFNIEMKEWRKEEKTRHKDFERTGGWRESAGALWAVGLGVGAGLASAFLLEDPLTRLAVDVLVNNNSLPALANWISANPIALLAPLLMLAAGPLCAGLVRPRTRTGCIICGAVTGAAAGGTLSALLGQCIAGLIPKADFINLAISPTPYSEMDWMYQLGLSVNGTFPWIYGAFIGFTVTGALAGGLLAGLVPAGNPECRQVCWPAPVAIAATPFLLAVADFNIVILALLGPAIQRILDQFGVTPGFSPSWIVVIGYGIPLLVILAAQLLALDSTHRSTLPTNQRWMVAVGFAGSGVLEMLLVLLLLSGNFYALPLIFLALEMFIEARRLARKEPEPAPDGVQSGLSGGTRSGAPERPAGRSSPLPTTRLPHWCAAGLSGGVLAGLVAQMISSAALVIVMIDVSMKAPLAEGKAPAVDPAKAEEFLRNAFVLNIASGLATLAVCALLGLIAGLLLQWTQNNLFLPLIWVWISGFGSQSSRLYPARASSRRLLAGLGGLGLGLLVSLADIRLGTMGILTTLLALGLLGGQAAGVSARRWPVWSVAAFFAICATGWIGLMVQGTQSIPIPEGAWRAVYALLVGPATACALFHLLATVHPAHRPMLRLGALAGLVALLGLGNLPVIGSSDLRANVFTYDGADWERVDFSPLPVGEGIVLYFHTDRKGDLWLASQSGLYLRRTASGWQPYLLNIGDSNSNANSSNRLMELSYPPYLNENADGSFWVVGRSQPGLFRPGETDTPFTTPQVTRADASVEKLPPLEPAMGMVSEPPGGPAKNLWLATLGSGLLKIEADRPLSNASWVVYDTTNSGLRSNQIKDILVDHQGGVWAASDYGVDRFNGKEWQAMDAARLEDTAQANCLLEDALGRVWVGTDAGVARWDGSAWQALSGETGWPGTVKIRRLYQDQDGHILGGTDQGALHFDGAAWQWVSQGSAISVFAEAPDGTLWMGDKGLVVRYNTDGTAQRFDVVDIGLPGGAVMDLHVEPNGHVWASIGTVHAWQPAGWEIPTLTGLLFAGGLAAVARQRKRENA